MKKRCENKLEDVHDELCMLTLVAGAATPSHQKNVTVVGDERRKIQFAKDSESKDQRANPRFPDVISVSVRHGLTGR